METITVTVSAEFADGTVRHLLKAGLHFSSRAISRLTRAEQGILVNGVRSRTTRVLAEGDLLQVETGDQRPPRVLAVPGDWELPIVWEDGHLLVVNKPAGMTAHVSNFLPDTPTVAGALAYTRGSNFLFHAVNRLDKGTTGLMVVAKSGYVHDLLRRALHTGQFYREYMAVCEGCPSPTKGVIDLPIGRDETSAVRRCIRPDGAPARTRYEVLASSKERSLVKLMPETGRTHQIRLHMASIGCPLTGDWLYGREDPALIARPALHSYALSLTHPVTGELLRLTAPLPADLLHLTESMKENKEERPMLTWNVTYHVKPGQREAFYKELCALGVRGNSIAEEGNLKYDYFFDAQDPDALLLVESWTDPALQRRHCETERFAALQALKGEYCLKVSIDKFEH